MKQNPYSIVLLIIGIIVLLFSSYRLGKSQTVKQYLIPHENHITFHEIRDCNTYITKYIYQDKTFGDVFIISSDLKLDEVNKLVRYLYPTNSEIVCISQVQIEYNN